MNTKKIILWSVTALIIIALILVSAFGALSWGITVPVAITAAVVAVWLSGWIAGWIAITAGSVAAIIIALVCVSIFTSKTPAPAATAGGDTEVIRPNVPGAAKKDEKDKEIEKLRAQLASKPSAPTASEQASTAPETDRWKPGQARIVREDRKVEKGKDGRPRIATETHYHQDLFDTTVQIQNGGKNKDKREGFCSKEDARISNGLKAIANNQGNTGKAVSEFRSCKVFSRFSQADVARTIEVINASNGTVETAIDLFQAQLDAEVRELFSHPNPAVPRAKAILTIALK